MKRRVLKFVCSILCNVTTNIADLKEQNVIEVKSNYSVINESRLQMCQNAKKKKKDSFHTAKLEI